MSLSDNIRAQEIRRRLVMFLRIPAEVWTDVLKTLPRRNLVLNISPACFRLNEIANKNVKTVHVIENAEQFTDKLEQNDPEANKQLEYLDGNKCKLAEQFRLDKIRIFEKSKAILRHCPDLFNDSKVGLNYEATLFLECLDQLEKAKPLLIGVFVGQLVDEVQAVNLWHHPTVQDCNRVHLFLMPGLLSAATLTTAFVNIFDWLHHRHRPDEMDCDGSSTAAPAQQQQQVRCLIIWSADPDHIDRLLDRCSQDIQRAHQDLNERRPYVFSFSFRISDPIWTGFGQFHRIENKSTGEVLVLDRGMNEEENGRPIRTYRLRRCLAEEEEATGPELYAGMFKRSGFHEELDAFNDVAGRMPLVIV